MLTLLQQDLQALADTEKAEFFPRFFRTGPGEYGEGDKFLGIPVPQQRAVARKYQDLNFADLKKLLAHEIHEYRLTALLILVLKFGKAPPEQKQKIAGFYLRNIAGVNNWDLVDASADKILGASLWGKNPEILYELAQSGQLWQQRIAIIATFYFIKKGEFVVTLEIAEILRDHPHDLIHKAVGWMLREIGKKDRAAEEKFLRKHYRKMPRTMLRYGIEHFPEVRRQAYLRGEISEK